MISTDEANFWSLISSKCKIKAKIEQAFTHMLTTATLLKKWCQGSKFCQLCWEHQLPGWLLQLHTTGHSPKRWILNSSSCSEKSKQLQSRYFIFNPQAGCATSPSCPSLSCLLAPCWIITKQQQRISLPLTWMCNFKLVLLAIICWYLPLSLAGLSPNSSKGSAHL